MKSEAEIRDKICSIELHRDVLNQSEWPKPSSILIDILKWVLSDEK